MSIRETNPTDFVANYSRPRFGSGEAEEAWQTRQAKRRAKQTVIAEVAEGCSVETVRETTLRDGEEVILEDVGGAINFDRLRRIGVLNVITENAVKTNRGEFEFTALKAFTYPGGVVDEGEGFAAELLDLPGTEGFQSVSADGGKIVSHPGQPPVDGAKKAEELIVRGLAERRKLRDKVAASFKKRRKAAAKVESEA